jgi:hypothetical protein
MTLKRTGGSLGVVAGCPANLVDEMSPLLTAARRSDILQLAERRNWRTTVSSDDYSEKPDFCVYEFQTKARVGAISSVTTNGQGGGYFNVMKEDPYANLDAIAPPVTLP